MRNPALSLALSLALLGASGLPARATGPPRPWASRAWTPPVAPASALPARVPIGAGESDVCGTTPQGALRLLALHSQWAAQATAILPTTQSFDRGNIAVLEDDGTLITPWGAHFEIDVVAAARAFYRTHGDDYDYLCIYTASSVPLVVLGNTAFAFEVNVVQDLQGIGLPLMDYSRDYGSAGHLHSLLNLNTLANYPGDPWQDFIVSNSTMDVLAHEAEHRWSAFVGTDSAGVPGYPLLGAGLSHWNFYFNNQASMVGGNEWDPNGNGTWTTTHATERYGNLELYLMGLIGPDEVGPLPILENPSNCTPPANYTYEHHPLVGVTCAGAPYDFSIADVIAANGPRVPDVAGSPKTHRFAFLLVIANGTEPAQADLDKLGTIVSLWPAYFSQLTGGRATADVTLSPRAGSVVIQHRALKDTEDTADPIPVTAQVSIRQGSVPIGLDPASVTLSFDTGGPPTTLPMSQTSPGVFQALIPPQPAGTTVRYGITADSDSAGIGAAWPTSDSLATFYVGPDLEPPQVSFLARPAMLKSGLLPYRFHALATDNQGVARVFATYSLDGGERDTAEMTRAGDSDTFYVDLAPGATDGQRLALDVHAVDAAAAAHEVVCPECPPPGCQFAWGENWIEPLDLTDGGLTSSALTYLFRDSWDWTGEGLASGRAWKCGDDGPSTYLPNLDAGLVTPALAVSGPVELRFRHRYDLEASTPGFAWDGALVEESIAGGPWAAIAPLGGYPAIMDPNSGTPLAPGTPVYTGRSAGWDAGDLEEAVFDLPDAGTTTVRFRFRLAADGFNGGGGWYVDDLRLLLQPAAVDAGGPRAPAALRFLDPWPNPARGRVRFAADLPAPGRVRLELFDVRGRRVAVLFAGAVGAGRWSTEWDVAAAAGAGARRGPPAGAYLVRLTLEDGAGPPRALVRRLVLLR